MGEKFRRSSGRRNVFFLGGSVLALGTGAYMNYLKGSHPRQTIDQYDWSNRNRFKNDTPRKRDDDWDDDGTAGTGDGFASDVTHAVDKVVKFSNEYHVSEALMVAGVLGVILVLLPAIKRFAQQPASQPAHT